MSDTNEFTADQEAISADEECEPIDYESLGKLMKRVRKERGLTQQTILEIPALAHFVTRSVYAKYESGTVKPSMDFIEAFATYFNLNLDEMLKKISIVIPDTCALLKNKRLLHMLLEDYDQVVVPRTVLSELSYRKNHGRSQGEKRAAWQIMANIDYYCTEYGERFKVMENDRFRVDATSRKIENDQKMIMLAQALQSEKIAHVVMVTDDVDVTTGYEDAVLLDKYVAKRAKTASHYDAILDLDKEFEHLEYYKKIIESLDLDAYLPDGMTLLISCIRNKNWRQYESISKSALKSKLKFLLDNGANPNRNDNGRYCLSPLAHCVQVSNYDAFEILLEYGADYNKCSQDESTFRHMKSGKLNEGNTPLMLACWHGRMSMAKRLCSLPGICLNQQDSNGYTALIKCAVQRYNRKKEGKPFEIQEKLYRFLIEKGTDQLIRDRENRTAQDWWDAGDELDEDI